MAKKVSLTRYSASIEINSFMTETQSWKKFGTLGAIVDHILIRVTLTLLLLSHLLAVIFLFIRLKKNY
jgi:hypothetical protein